MNDPTIWALKGPSSDDQKDLPRTQAFLTDSITKGTSRFGWSYIDTANLLDLKSKSWQEMSEGEQYCWRKSNFLLDVNKGDWVIHVNIPHWGACIAGQVSETYNFEQSGNTVGDFRHTLKLDPSTIVQFDRNDDRVLPIISSRLKLQGRYWRIRHVAEFNRTITNLRTEESGKTEVTSPGIFYLKQDLSPLLQSITEKIQQANPAGKLEGFIAEVLRKVPNVQEVIEHGKYKGWGTDHGADLVVKYNSGLSIGNLEKEDTLVVQVKSFTGRHWETNAVDQIEVAITKFDAAAGLIITTAQTTEDLERAVEALNDKLKKPIGLLAGDAVARFVLKYGGDLIL